MAKIGVRVPWAHNIFFIAPVAKTCKKLVDQKTKRNIMIEELSDQCQDPTQSITVELPCQMIERIERYAKKNGSTVSGVLMEALDTFLRNQGRS